MATKFEVGKTYVDHHGDEMTVVSRTKCFVTDQNGNKNRVYFGEDHFHGVRDFWGNRVDPVEYVSSENKHGNEHMTARCERGSEYQLKLEEYCKAKGYWKK